MTGIFKVYIFDICRKGIELDKVLSGDAGTLGERVRMRVDVRVLSGLGGLGEPQEATFVVYFFVLFILTYFDLSSVDGPVFDRGPSHWTASD